MTLVADFLAEHLDLDPDRICIQRAHRVEKPPKPHKFVIGQATNKPKHRPLIALFRDYQDVELILGSGAGQKTPDPKDTRHFLPGWTKDTTPFCQGEQKTPDNFSTVDRRHQTILPPWTEDTISPKLAKGTILFDQPEENV